MRVEVEVVNSSNNKLPKYETEGSVGLDVRANIDKRINPGERCLIPTGLKVSIPVGYEIQVRPRSGLALKKGISLVNSPGTIDSDYRGDVGVILINHGSKPFNITRGMRIAQLVLKEASQLIWEEVEDLEETDRGEGGFGHTGN